MSIYVEEAGLQTTIQDMGRPAVDKAGMRHLGIPRSGAADTVSLALANWLVGNPVHAPALEITLKGPVIIFEEAMDFALVGAPCDASLAGKPIEFNRTYRAQKGDRLDIGGVFYGCRCYLSVGGVIQSDVFLGSMSTYLTASLGGRKGHALKAGDKVYVDLSKVQHSRTVPEELAPSFERNWVLRCRPGPHFKTLTEQSREKLFSKRFLCGQRASRMGAELEAPVLHFKQSASLSSFAVFPGALQCPPSGQPFLLLCDAQTTGGYPVIAQVIRADLHMTGQLRPGDTVRFFGVSRKDAQSLLQQKLAAYKALLGCVIL